MKTYFVRPLDPVIFGTGRPFSSIPGTRLDSAELPPPSTVAGLVRSEAGRDATGKFDTSRIHELLKMQIRGPFLATLGDGNGPKLALPAPADHVRLTRQNADGVVVGHRLVRTVPLKVGSGEAVSDGERAPVGMRRPDLAKPARRSPGYWRAEELMRWLKEPSDALDVDANHGVVAPKIEWRTHVAVSGSTGTATDGALFTTGGRRFVGKVDGKAQPLALAFQTDAELPAGPVVLGGEGRLSMLEPTEQDLFGPPPPEVLQSARAGFVRAYFATPAHFGTGSTWQPPGSAHVVAQVHGRAQVISGWAMAPEEGEASSYPCARDRKRYGGRPKAIRRLVPAGAVYFLQLTKPTGEEPNDPDANERFVRELWGRSVHQGQDAADGFGVVLFGTWDGALVPLDPPPSDQ